MNSIIVYGNRNDKKITDILKGDLLKSGSFSFSDKKLIIETEAAKKIKTKKTKICVFKSGADVNRLNEVSENIICIANEKDTEIIKKLLDIKASTIICGMSGRCTVNYSSIQQNKAVVSLNRTIRTVKGKLIDPMEVLLTSFETDYEYEYLAAALLKIMLL